MVVVRELWTASPWPNYAWPSAQGVSQHQELNVCGQPLLLIADHKVNICSDSEKWEEGKP